MGGLGRLWASMFFIVLTGIASAQEAPVQGSVYHVEDYGAIGDAIVDNTEAFQKALDAAAATGGIVKAPAGKYRFEGHLNVPPHVGLEGVWQAPSRGLLSHGTILLPTEGQGDANGTPFITLHVDSSIEGFTIFYPEQIQANPPHAYPWTIRGDGDNVSVLSVTMVNTYQAVDFATEQAGRHYINGLYAQALYRGLIIDKCFDVGRIENIHFWPFWTVATSGPLFDFTNEHGIAFTFGRTDGEMATNLFCIFYSVGMLFTDLGTGGGAGMFTNCYLDVTPNAVRVESCMANAGVSFVNGSMMSGIETMPGNTGQVKFTGCGFWANREQRYHAKLEGIGAVIFDACHFTGWDRVNEGYPAIIANNRRFILTDSEFDTTRTDHRILEIGPRVRSGIVANNLMPGGAHIANHSLPRAHVVIENNVVESPSDFIQDWIVLGPFPNPKVYRDNDEHPDNTDGKFDPGIDIPLDRAGFDTDYLEALGGEAAAELAVDATVMLDGTEIRAQRTTVGPDGAVHFNRIFRQSEKTAYAFCYLKASKAGKALLEFGTNESSKVWLNHMPIYQQYYPNGHPFIPGENAIELELNEGLNPLLFKVEDAGGRRWGLFAEVYPVDGIEIEATLPE